MNEGENREQNGEEEVREMEEMKELLKEMLVELRKIDDYIDMQKAKEMISIQYNYKINCSTSKNLESQVTEKPAIDELVAQISNCLQKALSMH
ncbi:hypothetical protein [Thermoanaerobacter thermohydrosulfuricus]|nr:hypothetical protein [Thermoanaerobacter thermohydrosulfuricus]